MASTYGEWDIRLDWGPVNASDLTNYQHSNNCVCGTITSGYSKVEKNIHRQFLIAKNPPEK